MTPIKNVTYIADDNTSVVKKELIKRIEKKVILLTFYMADDMWAVNILVSLNY